MADLNPSADNYVELLLATLDLHKFKGEIRYAWNLRKQLGDIIAGSDTALSIADMSSPQPHMRLWPSAWAPEAHRWPRSVKDKNTGLWTVHMFGRAQIAKLYELLGVHSRVFLYGLTGVGKSHVLAMFALSCLAEHVRDDSKPPVCFIPDLENCVTDELGFHSALVQAFVCDPFALEELVKVRAELRTSVRNHFVSIQEFIKAHPILLVADQHNALDAVTHPSANKEMPARVATLVRGMLGLGSQVVFAASANQSSIHLLSARERNTHKVRLVCELLR